MAVPQLLPSSTMTIPSERAARTATLRIVAMAVLAVALGAAVYLQRGLIGDAISQIGKLSMLTIVGLVVLATYERLSRAGIMRRMLGDVSLGRAVTIHDVGNAVSKGVPFGGALGTALRWSIARDSGVPTTRFATTLVAYGIATTFASWLLPLIALLIDLTQRPARLTDVAMLIGIVVVLVLSVVFWSVVLRSERLEGWASRQTRGVWARLARRITACRSHDPASGIGAVRLELLEMAKRPWWILSRTVAAQACGAVILLVALRGVGVGDELGVTEFFRLFFLTHLLGTFAPTPGGIGVVEAGLTGALVAAGVTAPLALAGVVVYRLLTYVTPIVLGAVLYAVWSSRQARRLAVQAAEAALHPGPQRALNS
jgi:putative heme transporter